MDLAVKEKTWVAIGCSTTPDYAFLLPLTCLLWREVVGYEPLVMLAGPRSKWNRGTCDVVTSEMPFGTSVYWIGEAGDYSEATIAQNCRQHAAALNMVDDTDWVMPADADLWPLKREFYHQHEGTEHKAVCYYANGDHFQGKEVTLQRAAEGRASQTIPTCHVAMRAGDWRAIYGLTPGESVVAAVRCTLDAWLPGRVPLGAGYDANMVVWMSDQQLMTEALCQQTWFPQRAKMIERRGHPPVDRLDRGHLAHWESFDAGRWTDAHVHRQPWSDAHWPSLLRIVDALLPEHGEWAREYREAFTRAL